MLIRLRLKAKLSFPYETRREAQAVAEAVSPDNTETPIGLTVETVRDNCQLLAFVQCDKGLGTFLATLDDLLACISIAEKAFEAVQARL